MPRRNLWFLLLAGVVSAVCFHQADALYRNRLGQQFQTFAKLQEYIEEYYVEPVEDRELFEAALSGMVADLGDPNSAYFNPQKKALSQSQREQHFGGIGVEVTYDRISRQLSVMSPIVGTPAYEAGILAGDIIVKVNDQLVSEMSLEETTNILRGPQGTTVKISVLHLGETEPVELTIRRAIIRTETVQGDHRAPDGKWEYWIPDQDKLAYVRIIAFGRETANELERIIARLAKEGLRGLVIDVRNDPGGLLHGAIDVCELFVSKGRIVSTRGRGGKLRKAYDADGTAPFANLPLVVLINQWSASASEVTAACLQDHNRALVVGQRSYGKGTVQDVIPLEQGKAELHLTIATYWRPSEQNIHRGKKAKDSDPWGVQPDPGCELKLTDEEAAALSKRRRYHDAIRAPGAVKPPEAEAPLDDKQRELAIEKLKECAAGKAKSI
ncbi:MAG: S41 family peptidase [Planctomycetes bacterium]|nr:S41 family peptidase [Planctomycetota bacterium]